MTPTGSRRRLALAPLQPGEWLSVTPTRVIVRADGRPDEERRGPNDFRTTNALLNRLLAVRVGDTPFLEVVVYRGVPMWQFLPSYVWPEVFRAVELAEILAGLLEEADAEAFEAELATDATAGIWAGLVQAAGIALVQGTQPAHRAGAARRRTPRALAGAGRRRLRRLRPQLPARRVTAARGGVLLATLGRRHWVRRPGGEGSYDEQFSPLVPALQELGWKTIRLIDCQELPAEELRGRPLDAPAEWYHPGTFGRASDPAAGAQFAAAWERLRSDPGFREAFSHRGIALLPALEPVLRRAFHETLPECAAYLAGAAAILDELAPEALAVTYETGPQQRALVIEAARRSIPTVGLMHGTIYDTHYDYMHAEVTTDATAHPLGFAIPRVTCVWGDLWRDVLVESGSYPPGAVAVTGNPRVAEVLELARGADRSEVRARLGLPSEGRVVLVLTANQRVGGFLDAALAAIDPHTDCVPLVKPHPSDDVGLIVAKLHEHGFDEELLHRENLAEAILAADLVVSQLSTAALEAMLLRRPLVLVNLDRALGFAEPVLETGLSRYAETPAELSREVAAALAAGDFERDTEALHREFVEIWFAGARADAAGRIAAVITGLVPGRAERG